MTKSQLKIEIKLKKDSIELLDTELDGLRAQLVGAFMPYVKQQLQRAVETHIEQNAEQTKKLGKEKLGRMKKQFEKLLAASVKTVSAAFGDDALWPHVGYEISVRDYSSQLEGAKRAFSDGINRALDSLLMQSSALLEQYGYVAQQPALDRQFPGWKTDAALNLVYNVYPELPKQVEELMNQYKRLFEQLHIYKQRLAELRAMREKLEAVELWEQA